MAPLLIDGRDLLKLVLISVVAVSAVFAGGVFVGHQRAANFYQAGGMIQTLPLPVPVAVAENVLESQPPDEIEAGEYIDVDFPEPEVAATNTHDTSIAAIDTEHSNPFNSVNNSSNSAIESPVVITSAGTASLDEVKYSIQAGVYGRLLNAEKVVKQLRSYQYEAYITDYTNKKNETRYNVRFGFFANKKTALASLEKFKSEKNGDGYLVKFSADNMVNLADATAAGESSATPAHTEDDEDALTPAVTPSASMSDKISQLDVSTDMLIKTN